MIKYKVQKFDSDSGKVESRKPTSYNLAVKHMQSEFRAAESVEGAFVIAVAHDDKMNVVKFIYEDEVWEIVKA